MILRVLLISYYEKLEIHFQTKSNHHFVPEVLCSPFASDQEFHSLGTVLIPPLYVLLCKM